jgi:hypothetical protein
MLGITRARRIGMAHSGQHGSTIGNSIVLVMGSPFATGDLRLQHYVCGICRAIAGPIEAWLSAPYSRDWMEAKNPNNLALIRARESQMVIS